MGQMQCDRHFQMSQGDKHNILTHFDVHNPIFPCDKHFSMSQCDKYNPLSNYDKPIPMPYREKHKPLS